VLLAGRQSGPPHGHGHGKMKRTPRTKQTEETETFNEFRQQNSTYQLLDLSSQFCINSQPHSHIISPQHHVGRHRDS
jgi:hypothetical protein